MSRVSETYETMEEMKRMMVGNVKKPTLCLVPLLAQIALSLATIADAMKGTDDE